MESGAESICGNMAFRKDKRFSSLSFLVKKKKFFQFEIANDGEKRQKTQQIEESVYFYW